MSFNVISHDFSLSLIIDTLSNLMNRIYDLIIMVWKWSKNFEIPFFFAFVLEPFAWVKNFVHPIRDFYSITRNPAFSGLGSKAM